MSSVIKFGKEIRETEFTLKNGVTFINHGSYGAVPRRIQEEQLRLFHEMHDNPDLWFRRNLRLRIEESRKCIADFVNADPDNLVFVQNATTGVNTVLNSLVKTLGRGDIILCTEYSYQSVKNACEAVAETSEKADLKTHYLPLRFPIKTEDEVVEMYREFFTNNSQTKLAILDHITSPSAIRMPLEKLIPLCRQFGVLSLIDGAHAPGQIPIDMKKLSPDFYTGNLHKWLYTPRGCAFLYISKEYKTVIKPIVTSRGYKKDIQTDFFYQGTCDDTPYCVIPEAIKFYKTVLGGFDNIHDYLSDLLDKAVVLLTSIWGTHKLAIPKSMEAPWMKIVKLPKLDCFNVLSDFDRVEPIIKDHLVNHNISVQYAYVDGAMYIRLSANVYNTFEDYQKLCDFICKLME